MLNGKILSILSLLTFSLSSLAADLSAAELGDAGLHLRINKGALDTPFLMHTVLIPALHSATLASTCDSRLQDRIVLFKRVGKLVYLLESAEGHNVGALSSNDFPLVSFPLIDEDEHTLVFDFNTGMDRYFLPRSELLAEANFDLIHNRYLSSILSHDNLLQIRQVVQIDSTLEEQNPSSHKSEFGEIQYWFSRYQSNPNFTPKRITTVSGPQPFFLTPLQRLPTGKQHAFATKWDISKPILFMMSANTPNQFRGAIKEGVLYWNRVFGKEIFQVTDAPEGVTAPHPAFNVIQWLESEGAQAAYADMASDPRTGEIKHAQVFIPSVWVSSTEKVFRSYERTLHKVANPWERYFKAGASPTWILKVQQDTVRETVAHEMGHILGLRHNFFASAYASHSHEEIEEWLNTYLFQDHLNLLQTPYVASSVMDYLDMHAGVVQGMRIGQGDTFSYDKQAIHNLYYEERPFKPTGFCTDEETQSFEDCKKGDLGPSPIRRHISAIRQILDDLPAALLENFILQKRQGRFGEINPELYTLKASVLEHFTALLGMMSDESVKLKSFIERLPNFNIYPDEMRAMHNDFLWKEIEVYGSVEEAILFLLPPYRDDQRSVAAHMKRLKQMLDDNYQGYVTDGEPYYFSDDEQAAILIIGKQFFEAFEKYLLRDIVKQASKVVVSDPELGEEFERALGTAVLYLLLDDVGRGFSAIGKANTCTQVSTYFPKFRYPQEVRVAAISLLHAAVASGDDWSLELRKVLQRKLQDRGCFDLTLFQDAENHSAVRKWIFEQTQILSGLSKT